MTTSSHGLAVLSQLKAGTLPVLLTRSWAGIWSLPWPAGSLNTGYESDVRFSVFGSLVTGTAVGRRYWVCHTPLRHDGSVGDVLAAQNATRMLVVGSKFLAVTNTYWPSLRLFTGPTSMVGQFVV